MEAVTYKTGLQCKGTCGTWAHFTCLNFTPGKIKDIKSGIIQVTCPCPDCAVLGQREFRTDEQYTCESNVCPANVPPPPTCIESDCPENKKKPCCPRAPCPPKPCPPRPCPPKPTCPPKPCPPPCAPKPSKPPCPPKPFCLPKPICSTDACLTSSSSNSSDSDVLSKPCDLSEVEQMYATVGQLSHQLKELMKKMLPCENPCKQDSRQECKTSPCYCPGNPKCKKK